MLMSRIIPCLDVRDGRVVKGTQFQNLRDAGDPIELATRYEADGADELVMLDIAATTQARIARVDTVRSLRQVLSIPLTVGGGVDSIDDVRLLLEAGADKVSVNSAAVANPALISEMAERFGRQCTVIAVDAKRHESGWRVLTHSGSRDAGLDAIEWIHRCSSNGAGEVLLTSWDRDGSGIGYDTALLRAARAVTTAPIIASGGGASSDHFVNAFEAGADAVLAASIFHFNETTVCAVKQALDERGQEVRL